MARVQQYVLAGGLSQVEGSFGSTDERCQFLGCYWSTTSMVVT